MATKIPTNDSLPEKAKKKTCKEDKPCKTCKTSKSAPSGAASSMESKPKNTSTQPVAENKSKQKANEVSEDTGLLVEMERIQVALAGLRSTFVEVAEQFSLKLHGQIMELQTLVGSQSATTNSILSRKELNKALETIEQLKLKPAKGRFKDVERIADAVDKLGEILNKDKS